MERPRTNRSRPAAPRGTAAPRRGGAPPGRGPDIAARTRVVLGLFALALAAVLGRAVWLSAVPNEQLSAALRRQQQATVKLNPRRGRIQDRAGRDLAVSVTVPSVFADPQFLVETGGDPVDVAARLAPLLDLPAADLAKALRAPGRFVWLARQVPTDVATAIEELRLPGVRVTDEFERRYPNGTLAGQVLGFTGTDGAGLEGLEKRFDSRLRGREERHTVLRDGKRRNITPEGVAVTREVQGDDLVLTLDRNIQFAAEQALAEAVTKWEARAGLVVVMDVQTGAVLAQATAPPMDPNYFARYDRSTWRDMSLSFNYESGSVLKAFLISSALEAGVVTPDTRFDCELGAYRFGRRTIHDSHPYGVLDVREILKVSSNIGTTKVAERLGAEAVWSWYRAWGFGQPTGIDLPGESGGILRHWKSWYPIDLATHAFGQGVSVTGLQIAAALSAVANGGRLMRPYIVQEVRSPDGSVVERTEPTEVRRVISPGTAAEMRGMMAGVMEEGGTGTLARLDDYTAAGKTGTAQKVNPETGRYQFWVSSFVGFAPVEDPRVAIVVTLDEPRRHHYGGTVAGPVFRAVGRQALTTLDVDPLPDRMARLPVNTPAPAGPAAPPSSPALAGAGSGSGTAAAAGELPPAVMPDLRGASLREALRRLAGVQARIDLEGSGVLTEQHPAPGARLAGISSVRLAFAPPAPPPPPSAPGGGLGSAPVAAPGAAAAPAATPGRVGSPGAHRREGDLP